MQSLIREGNRFWHEQQAVGLFSIWLSMKCAVYWSGCESALFSESLCFYLSLNPRPELHCQHDVITGWYSHLHFLSWQQQSMHQHWGEVYNFSWWLDGRARVTAQYFLHQWMMWDFTGSRYISNAWKNLYFYHLPRNPSAFIRRLLLVSFYFSSSWLFIILCFFSVLWELPGLKSPTFDTVAEHILRVAITPAYFMRKLSSQWG